MNRRNSKTSNKKIKPVQSDNKTNKSESESKNDSVYIEDSEVRKTKKTHKKAAVIDGLVKSEEKIRARANTLNAKPKTVKLERSQSSASLKYRSRKNAEQKTEVVTEQAGDLETIEDEDENRDKIDTPKKSLLTRKLSKLVKSADLGFKGLKRSLSFNRDLSKKPTDPKLLSKNGKWSASLQSLQEIDTGISYKDLSFVNYDLFNDHKYDGLDENRNRYKPVVRRNSSRRIDSSRPGSRYSDGSRYEYELDLCPKCNNGIHNNRYSDGFADMNPCVCGYNNCINRIVVNTPLNIGRFPDSGRLRCCCERRESGNNFVSRSQSMNIQRNINSIISHNHHPETKKYQSTADLVASNRSKSTEHALSGRSHNYRRAISHTPGAGAPHTLVGPISAWEHPPTLPTELHPTPHPATSRDTIRDTQSRVSDDEVRSRSLTHLDRLDPAMLVKQTPTTTTPPKLNGELPLKDSRSEPDCAGALSERMLFVPDNTGRPASEKTTPSVGHSSSFRRQKLARSQVSSSEYFSVAFDVGDCGSNLGLNQTREEFIQAQKGVLLVDALQVACERYNIDLNQCAVIADIHPNILSPHSTDTGNLAGKHIKITSKEGLKKSSYQNHATLQKSSSASYRGRPGRFFSSSTEDACAGPEMDARKGRQRWSGFFGNNKDTKIEQLTELLNNFSRHGVQTTPANLGPPHAPPQPAPEAEEALINLEENWQDIINTTAMSEPERQYQTALWELLTTEAAYIRTLRVVTDLFLACLERLQDSNILTEIDQNKLFSNIYEIYQSNMTFWSMYMYPMLRNSRETAQPLNCDYFLDGFLRFEEVFEPYVKFCAEQSTCQHYCREMHTQNELFTVYLAWCETQKECNRLRLADILVRPMQRLTKYSLLLQAAKKHAIEPRDYEGLENMSRSVDDFVASVNATLRQRQENERLKGIMARIDSYDAVEAKDDELEKMIKSHSELDLSAPMAGTCRQRHLLMEGDLRLRDTSSKVDVHCFLLTDMLLICKLSTKRGGATVKVIRQPFLTDRLVVKELSRDPPALACVYLNEYKMAVAAFTLTCSESKVLKSWSECLKKASHLYAQCKQNNPPAPLHYTGGVHSDQWGTGEGDQSLSCDLDYDSHAAALGNLAASGCTGTLMNTQRSPLAGSSRGSRVSSLAHSHSGSVEMNDSISSMNPTSRNISIEQDLRTTSISSDEGIPPLAQELPKSTVTTIHENALKLTVGKTSPALKNRVKIPTPNTLSVQPYGSLGQSLPNLTLSMQNAGTYMQSLVSPHTLRVPPGAHGGGGTHVSHGGTHLLSPHHRGTSYPPPSPTRGSLRRGFAFSAHKNPPLIKTRHITSHSASIAGPCSTSIANTSISNQTASASAAPGASTSAVNVSQTAPFLPLGSATKTNPREVPTPAAVNVKLLENYDNVRACRQYRRHYTTGDLYDIRRNDNRDHNAYKRFSWNIENSSTNHVTTNYQTQTPFYIKMADIKDQSLSNMNTSNEPLEEDI